MKSQRTKVGGFTLIELVATIVIMSILAAVTVPRFSDTSTFSERGYTDEIASALRYAQRIAIASRCAVRITINAANYSAVQQAGCLTAGAWNASVRRPDGNSLAGSPPAGVVLTPAATTLTFNDTGGVEGEANTAFTVGANFAVFVDGITGSVTTQP